MSDYKKQQINAGRSPSVTDFDRVFVTLSWVPFVMLGAFWLGWMNFEAAATSSMLKMNRAEADGFLVVEKYKGVNSVVGYSYYDSSGVEWARKLEFSFYYSKNTVEKFKNFAKKSNSVALLERANNLSLKPVKIYYHPTYPKYFARQVDLKIYEYSIYLVVGTFVFFFASGFLGYRAIRRYFYLKKQKARY